MSVGPGGPALRAVHFGPSLDFVGGMATVMRVAQEHQLGARVEVCPTWLPTSRAATLTAMGRALARVRALGPGDVVHVHVSQGGSFVRKGALLRLARGRGLPTVATIHGSRFAAFARGRPGLVRRVLGWADVVVCLTDESAAVLAELGVAAHVEIVPNPMVGDPHAPPADATGEVVLFAGEVGERKGVDVLLSAWPAVLDRRPDARLLLVGPRTALEVPALPGVELRDPVEPPALRALVREARVLALPSRAEAMPMFLLEGLGAARPFVSTPVGQIPSVAEGGSRIVGVGDAAALADALAGFLADPSAARAAGEAGRRACERLRGVEVVRERMAAVYAEAAARAQIRA